MSIFGAPFDVSRDRWIAFNEETLTSLSEHKTQVAALEACRRYLESEIRRTNILHYSVYSRDLKRTWLFLDDSDHVTDGGDFER